MGTSTEVERYGSALLMRFAVLALLLLLSHKSYVSTTNHQQQSSNGLRSLQSQDEAAPSTAYPFLFEASSEEYFVFLQKFPLQNSFKMIFHTEVVVCPREAFSNDAHFLETLDALILELPPSSFEDIIINKKSKKQIHFAAVAKNQWKAQSDPTCVQLGYGGNTVWSSVHNAYEFCRTACCGSPHRSGNTNYALSSKDAVITNAMGEDKEVYLYGKSTMSGEDAYMAVCHGHVNAVEEDKLPVCVSNWAGTDYNALTNNCNTFTSTVLKCVYGMSDSKPDLGVSDMVNVSCPTEKINGKDLQMCAVPKSADRIKSSGLLSLQ